MGGDGKHVLRLDLLPAPQQGESRLTSGDRIPGEGHTCIRSGSQFWSGVTGLARVTPFGPVASSRRETRPFRGAHGGSPSAAQLREENGDGTGGHEATAGQRTVSENELLSPAAEGAGTRNKTPKARTAHGTEGRVRACAGAFAKQAAGAAERLGGGTGGASCHVRPRLGRVRGTPGTASEIRRLCQRAGHGGTHRPGRAGRGASPGGGRGSHWSVSGWFNNHRWSTAQCYGSRTA